MSYIKTTTEDEVTVVTFDNGITNAISFEFVNELASCLAELQQSSSAVVLTGNSKFFSIGWNLPELTQYDRATLSDFIHGFQEMMLVLATLPVPTLCAIDGHAVAGGTILTLGCDYRIARKGNVKVGLNESRLGVPIPWIADILMKQLLGHDVARKVSYEGEIMNVDRAFTYGMIDELLENDSVLDLTVQKAAELKQIPASAFAAIKQSHYEQLVDEYRSGVDEKTEQFMDVWFEEETQILLKKATEKF